jgi:hypothetical protein
LYLEKGLKINVPVVYGIENSFAKLLIIEFLINQHSFFELISYNNFKISLDLLIMDAYEAASIYLFNSL